MLLVLFFGVTMLLALSVGVDLTTYRDQGLFWFFWVLYLVCTAAIGWGDRFMSLAGCAG